MEEPGLIYAALAKAQAKFPKITKDNDASITSERTGRTFTYSYADIADVLAAVRPVLAEFDIALVQRTDVLGNGGHLLVTTLYATDGSFVESQWRLRDLDQPQDAGGDLTYFRRYQLCALCGVASEEDDDDQRSRGGGSSGDYGYEETGEAPRARAPRAPSAPKVVDPPIVTDVSVPSTSTSRQQFRDWLRTVVDASDLRDVMKRWMENNGVDRRVATLSNAAMQATIDEWQRMSTEEPFEVPEDPRVDEALRGDGSTDDTAAIQEQFDADSPYDPAADTTAEV